MLYQVQNGFLSRNRERISHYKTVRKPSKTAAWFSSLQFPVPLKNSSLRRNLLSQKIRKHKEFGEEKNHFSGSSFAAITQLFGLFLGLQTWGSKNGKAIDLDVAPGVLQAWVSQRNVTALHHLPAQRSFSYIYFFVLFCLTIRHIASFFHFVFYSCFLFITCIINNDFFSSTSLVSIWSPLYQVFHKS